MDKKYGIVLVGCGYMGAAHLDEIYYRDNIEVVGVVDVDSTKAQSFVRKYGALSWDTEYKRYLDDPTVDIFIIATYPSTHLKILDDCLRNAKNVLCEKPITTTLEEAKAFVNMVKVSDSKILVGHILRHNKTYNKVAEMIREGAIGSPIVIRMVQNKHTKDWERYRKLINNTSPIIDCGVHYIDVMQWFTNSRITNISGIGVRTEEDLSPNSYNYGMFSAKFEDGSVGYYEAGWGNTIASENIKEFIGPKGRIKIVYRKDRNTHQEEGDLVEYYSCSGNEYRILNIDSDRKPTWDQLQHLIKMIEEGVDAIPNIDQVYNAFEIALAVDKAIITGKAVELRRE